MYRTFHQTNIEQFCFDLSSQKRPQRKLLLFVLKKTHFSMNSAYSQIDKKLQRWECQGFTLNDCNDFQKPGVESRNTSIQVKGTMPGASSSKSMHYRSNANNSTTRSTFNAFTMKHTSVATQSYESREYRSA